MNSRTSTTGPRFQERTILFANGIRSFVRRLPPAIAAGDDAQQLLQVSASIAAGVIAASEADGAKDFAAHVRNAFKYAKETSFWLRLLDAGADDALAAQRTELVEEAKRLLRIFLDILRHIRLKERRQQ